jgi:hypothetical protein
MGSLPKQFVPLGPTLPQSPPFQVPLAVMCSAVPALKLRPVSSGDAS